MTERVEVSDRITVERHPDADPPVYVVRMQREAAPGVSEVYLDYDEAEQVAAFVHKTELRAAFDDTANPDDRQPFRPVIQYVECDRCGEKAMPYDKSRESQHTRGFQCENCGVRL